MKKAYRSSDKFAPIKIDGWNVRMNYPAATHTHITASWPTSSRSANDIIYSQLAALRARSREQYASNDYIKRFVRLCKTNIVGHTGIEFKSYARGIDGKVDRDLSDKAEEEVNEWLADGVDFFNELDWIGLLNLVCSSLVIDGESFTRVYTERGVNRWGIALEHIDSARLDHTYFNNLRNGNKIKFGIEYFPNGRVAAYHISQQPYGYSNNYGRKDNPGNSMIRVPASRMIHVFEREYAEQCRGIPRCATALSRTYQMGSYEEAALVNARHGASKMVFLSSPDGRGMPGDDYWPNGYKVKNVVPGMIEELPEGVTPVAFDPTYPNNEFEPYISRNLRGAASGLNVAYESLSNDRKGVNFSSLRSGVQEDRDSWKELQTLVISQFCKKVIGLYFDTRSSYEDSVFSPPYDYEEEFKDITRHKWDARNWPWVDPLKDVLASKEEIALGVKSRAQHMRDANRDPYDTIEEIARERKLYADLGILDPMSNEGLVESQIGGDDEQ